MLNRRNLILSLLLSVAAGAHTAPARSEAPVYKDAERSGPRGEADVYGTEPNTAGVRSHGRPARRVTGGPGYVGSDYGLGKPAFTGLGSRPDWGRSSD